MVPEHQFELRVDRNNDARFVGDKNRIWHRFRNRTAERAFSEPGFRIIHGRGGDIAILGDNRVRFVRGADRDWLPKRWFVRSGLFDVRGHVDVRDLFDVHGAVSWWCGNVRAGFAGAAVF
jgi:hypothetical protein